MDLFINSLKIIIALGLLNVWFLRVNKETFYRGGKAKNLKDEFAFYGLPNYFFYLIGGLKISSALLLFLSLSYPQLSLYPSLVIGSLMLGAIVMHIKSRDSIKKTTPALIMFIMSGVVCFYYF